VRIDSDIDIDFGSRDRLLELIKHTNAAMRNVNPIRKHATGVYVTPIPYDPINDIASIDYTVAEKRGYFKLDLLNVHVYENVRDEQHLNELMVEPDWTKLKDKSFVEKLIHLNNQYYNLEKMPEPIDSIPRLSMFLAVIRPGKKHLIGKTWSEISKTVWDKGTDGYVFKRSHSVAYAQLVVVHMNLLRHSLNEGDTTAFTSAFP
jgi:hypothetical protein